MNEQNPDAWPDVPEELRRALAAEVSLGSRIRHLSLGLAGAGMAALVALLWATEPQPLPARTQAAFAVLVLIGLAWAAFAGWVLARRRPLFARDRVLGARIALAATVVTGAAGTALAAARAGTAEAVTAASVSAALVVAAVTVLLRARSRHRDLLRLRDALRRDAS